MVKPLAFVVVAIAVVAALWLFFKPAGPGLQVPDHARGAGLDAPAAMGVPAGTAGPQSSSGSSDVFELTVKDGKLVSGSALMRVHEGEQVTLNIKSNRSDELHLHGYDLHARVSPGETASLQFTANHTGRFGLELHQAHTELGALEVYPR